MPCQILNTACSLNKLGVKTELESKVNVFFSWMSLRLKVKANHDECVLYCGGHFLATQLPYVTKEKYFTRDR